MSSAIADANASFCATLVDQWITDGVTYAAVAPGSRSTPLVLAIAERAKLRVDVFHDERSAAFAALGHGLITGRPALVACTSGTAAAHFHAAVVEADLSSVPLIVCTADRPPELWGRGAPQTINQTALYGEAVRLFAEPGPPDETEPNAWRTLARRALHAATRGRPGPVHLNLSFREPLTGEAGALPSPLGPPESDAVAPPQPSSIESIAAQCRSKQGVIVAGRGPTDADDIVAFADRLGWPVLADHRSGCRRPVQPRVIDRYDSLLRSVAFVDAHRPEVIIRLGEVVSSKAVSQWLSGVACPMLAGKPHGRLIDPENCATSYFDEPGSLPAILDAIGDHPAPDAWAASWRRCDDAAERAIQRTLEQIPDHLTTTEIGVARRVVETLPDDGVLVVASSMPVRDVEWFGGRHGSATVVANRGANGIDGTIATAIGVAATGRPTSVLIGDVALIHDSTSLVGLADRSLDLTIIIIDNDGGGIFSFLPQSQLLDPRRFEQLFGTPHGTDLIALARAHRIDAASLDAQTDLTPNGTRLFVARTDRNDNRRQHDAAIAAVSDAVDDLLRQL